MLSRILNKLIRTRTSDARSRRFVAVIECLLNQNARDEGAACSPAMDFQLLQLCHRHHVGLLQMPCPEIHLLGLARTRDAGQTIRDALRTDSCASRCAALAADIANRIENYLDRGYELIAVLGGNPESPGCAIHNGADGLYERSGILMKHLQNELQRRGHAALFKAIRDHDPVMHQHDLESFERLLSDR